MDPLTHSLSGVVLGNLLAPDPFRLEYTAVCVIAANLPDIDFVTRPLKTLGSPKYYHNLTHSILGLTVISLLGAGLTQALLPSLHLGVLFVLYLLGCTLHVLLDTVITSCYVRLLWPFSNRQFSLAFLVGLNFRTASRRCGRPEYLRCTLCQLRGSLFNPFLLLFAAGSLLGLVWPDHRRLLSFLVLQIGALYLVGIYLWKRHLKKSLVVRFPEVVESALSLYPADLVPCRWLAIENREREYRLFFVRGFSPRVVREMSLPRPEGVSHPVVGLSIQTPLHEIYRNRMAHPYAELAERNGIIQVTWKDLRYFQNPDVDLYALKFQYTGDLRPVFSEFRERWGEQFPVPGRIANAEKAC